MIEKAVKKDIESGRKCDMSTIILWLILDKLKSVIAAQPYRSSLASIDGGWLGCPIAEYRQQGVELFRKAAETQEGRHG